MSKGFLAGARSYVKNVWGHTKLAAPREETISAPVDLDVSGPHGKAVQLVKAGRRKYDARDYATAEKCFRSATFEDPKYALAVTYLGHCLLKMGRRDDAIAAWQQACEMDPDSYAAQRARRKLQQMQRGETRLTSDLEDEMS